MKPFVLLVVVFTFMVVLWPAPSFAQNPLSDEEQARLDTLLAAIEQANAMPSGSVHLYGEIVTNTRVEIPDNTTDQQIVAIVEDQLDIETVGPVRNMRSGFTQSYSQTENDTLARAYKLKGQRILVDGIVYANVAYDEAVGENPAVPEEWVRVDEDVLQVYPALRTVDVNVWLDHAQTSLPAPVFDAITLDAIAVQTTAIVVDAQTDPDGRALDVYQVTLDVDSALPLLGMSEDDDSQSQVWATLQVEPVTFTFVLNSDDRLISYDFTWNGRSERLPLSELFPTTDDDAFFQFDLSFTYTMTLLAEAPATPIAAPPLLSE